MNQIPKFEKLEPVISGFFFPEENNLNNRPLSEMVAAPYCLAESLDLTLQWKSAKHFQISDICSIWIFKMTPRCMKLHWTHLLCIVVKQVDEAVGARGVNVEEERQVNHHGQGEQQRFHRHARPDEHDHSQHGQQAAVQVVLEVWGDI